MKKTRILALIMVIAVLVSLLAGCGSKAPAAEAPKAEAPAADAPAAAAPAEKEVTLRFVSWNSNYADLDQKVADAYKELHPNVTVEFEYYGDMQSAEYYKKVDLMVVGGEKMDILMASAYAEHMQRAASGAYVALDDYFAAEGIDGAEEYVVMPDVDGVHYGIPGDLKYQIVYLNKSKLDAAGLEVPSLDWTWDDYREYAKAMTSGEGASKVYGSYFHGWDHYNLMGFWSCYENNPMFTLDGSAVNFDHPLFADWLQFRYDMENVDKCQISYTDVKAMSLNYRDQFFNGNAAMLPVGSFLVAELDDQDKYPHDFVTTFAPIPAWGDAQPGTTYCDSQFYSVCKNSEHPQEAYDFIRYYTTEGMRMRGVSVSAEAGIDVLEFFEMMVDDTSYVDMEALGAVLNNPNFKALLYTNVPSYNKELANTMVEEAGKFLLGQDTLENVVDTLMKKGAALMADNK